MLIEAIADAQRCKACKTDKNVTPIDFGPTSTPRIVPLCDACLSEVIDAPRYVDQADGTVKEVTDHEKRHTYH